jgi:hypothetical protein
MSAAYTGEGKTDAKDAYVIAETLRLRRDLPLVDTVTDLTRELALLTAHRSDLIADRVRMINRLRDVMASVFPTLEQQFDYSSHKGALILLTEYASPKRLRRLGETRLTQWLRRRQVRDAARVAARGQDIELPGQHVAEMIIAELAASLLQLDQRIHGLDQQIAATFLPSLLSASPSPQRPQLTEGRHILTAARPGRSSCTRFSPNSATESLGKSPSPTAEMPRASVSRG